MFKIMPAAAFAGNFLPQRFAGFDARAMMDRWAAPRLRRRSGRLGRAALWSALTLAGAAATLVWLAAPGPAPVDEPKLAWIDIQKPFALFDVNLPAFQSLERAYEARRHAEGGGRRDRLAFGRLGETPYLRFEVYRLGTESAPRASLHVTAARRASDIGYGLARSGPVGGIASRFGLVEVADVTLERGGARQHCLAFQTAAPAGDDAAAPDVMRLSGLSCDEQGVAPSRSALACQVDQIQLMAAGEDAGLRDAFVAADQRPGAACTPNRLAGVEPATRAAQAAEKRAPRLRGAAATPDHAARAVAAASTSKQAMR